MSVATATPRPAPHPAPSLARSAEIERLFSHVIKGPGPEDCWFWVGAIADDGYGRFAIRRDGRQRSVRPQRLLYEHVTGRALTRDVILLHRCDIPLCVHVTAGRDSHLSVGSGIENMRDRERKGRAGRDGLGLRGLSRQQLSARSRRLRETLLRDGWNTDNIRAALADVDPSHPRLF